MLNVDHDCLGSCTSIDSRRERDLAQPELIGVERRRRRPERIDEGDLLDVDEALYPVRRGSGEVDDFAAADRPADLQGVEVGATVVEVAKLNLVGVADDQRVV